MPPLNTDKLAQELRERQKNNTESSRVHQKIRHAYDTNSLTLPTPQWHLKETDIDLDLQRNSLDSRLLTKGFTIIPDVDIEVLFDKMTEADAAMFRRRKLFESSNDWNTSAILNSWIEGQKLIPPTILIFDKEYAETISRDIIASTELQPVDGKHRINIAYCCGVKFIPILVRNEQLAKIKNELGL